MTMNFFKDTLNGPFSSPSPLQRLPVFQDHAGDYIQDYIMNGGSPAHVLDQLNQSTENQEESK